MTKKSLILALEVRLVEDSSKNASKCRSGSSKWQNSGDLDYNKRNHNVRLASNGPVVRKVATYNEETHKRNSGLLTTDSWRHISHSTTLLGKLSFETQDFLRYENHLQ